MIYLLPDQPPMVMLVGPDNAGFWAALGERSAGRYALVIGDPNRPNACVVAVGALLDIARYLHPFEGQLVPQLRDISTTAQIGLTPDQRSRLFPAEPAARQAKPPASDEPLTQLPHTGLQIPAGVALSVVDYAELQMPSGLAFTAVLTLDGVVVGTVENHGMGGATMYRPVADSTLRRADLDALTARCRTATGHAVDEERLLDSLVIEAEANKTVTRHTAAGRVPLRLVAGLDSGDYMPLRTDASSAPAEVATPASRTRLHTWLQEVAPTQAGEWWQFWSAQGWQDLTERDAGAPDEP